MSKIRVVSSAVFLAGFAVAATGAAQDKKPAPMPAAAKPAAAPAAAPAPAAKPAMPAAPAKANAPGMPAAPPPAAAAPAGPPMPAPSKELEAFMKGFEGSWKCDTKFAAGAMGPGSPEMAAKSTVKIKKEFGGFSWHGEYNLAKSKTMPAMSGIFQIAFDPGSNQATTVGYDSMGSSFMGAGAIAGDSVTFTEDAFMMGMKAKVKETMVKKGPKEVSHVFMVDMGKGMMPMGEDNCKK